RPDRHDDRHHGAGGRVHEVVAPVDVERHRVGQQQHAQDRERAEHAVLYGDPRGVAPPRPRVEGQDAFFFAAGFRADVGSVVSAFVSPFAASSASRSRRFDSSLAASLACPAYMSTYSWPERFMISYMISSVI